MTTERLNLANPGGTVAPGTHPVAFTAEKTMLTASDRGWYRRLQDRRRTWAAIRGFREVVLIAAVYSLYDLTRYFVEGKTSVAMGHGRELLRFEKQIGTAPEHVLNKIFTAHLSLGLPADYIYATLHYIVTPVVLVWMWRRHGSSYASARTVLMVATILALVGYSLFPVAPPRLLHGFGFVDTMAKFSHYGWWSNAASAPRGLGADTNQFAAMPSLHVGWAIWCGWMLFRHGTHRSTRIFGVAYPLLLSFDVMVTANHYLVDVLAGGAAMAVAYLVVRLLARAGIVSFPKRGSDEAPSAVEPLAA